MTEHEQPQEGTVEPDTGPDTGPDVGQVEAEREQRLDPDNRPDGAEVDNTDRDFDPEKGMFTDRDDYDATGQVYPPVEEQDT